MKAELLLSLQHNTYRQEDFEVANDCKIRALAFRNVSLATKLVVLIIAYNILYDWNGTRDKHVEWHSVTC
jgi:hypothetical protein